MVEVEAIRRAGVTIVGLGGIGSHVAVALVRAGVGHLRIIDFDRVEESNLGRQYYDREDIGRYKTEALYTHLKKINPTCEVEQINVKLTPETATTYLRDHTYICEAVDRADVKAWLSTEVRLLPNKPVLVGCSGMAGWGDSNDIHCRKIASHWYVCGDFTSDIDEIGKITAARVMVCAGHMANKIIQEIQQNEVSTEFRR